MIRKYIANTKDINLFKEQLIKIGINISEIFYTYNGITFGDEIKVLSNDSFICGFFKHEKYNEIMVIWGEDKNVPLSYCNIDYID